MQTTSNGGAEARARIGWVMMKKRKRRARAAAEQRTRRIFRVVMVDEWERLQK